MSGYRYITVPQAVVVVDDEGKVLRETTFDLFVKGRVRDEKHFGDSLDGLLAATSLEKEFRGKKPGYIAKVSVAEAERLIKSVKNPSVPYLVEIAVQLIPFMRAIVDAPEEPPASPSKPLAAVKG